MLLVRFSHKHKLCFGVPQSSVAGPVLFTLYSQNLSQVISQSTWGHHRFSGGGGGGTKREGGKRERERDRDRQTDRQIETHRETER